MHTLLRGYIFLRASHFEHYANYHSLACLTNVSFCRVYTCVILIPWHYYEDIWKDCMKYWWANPVILLVIQTIVNGSSDEFIWYCISPIFVLLHKVVWYKKKRHTPCLRERWLDNFKRFFMHIQSCTKQSVSKVQFQFQFFLGSH